jgi:hypothetical protein
MQDSAVFGHVDLVATEHGVNALAQARFLGELHQQWQGLLGDAVFRVVEVEAGALDCQALAALGVITEKLAEVQSLDLRVMGLELLPGRTLGKRC